MNASYLIDLRRRYDGKELKKRIDALQIELFQYEEERILYHPRSHKIWAAIISVVVMVAITGAIIYPYNLLDEPIAMIIMGFTMFFGWLFGYELNVDMFRPKVEMEKAKKITLNDFLSACDCQVVCGRRRRVSYIPRHYIHPREVTEPTKDVMVSS
jgi:hypothetical protein